MSLKERIHRKLLTWGPTARFAAWLRGTKVGKRIMEDEEYRLFFSATQSLSIDYLYAAFHLWTGFWSHSPWFVSMGIYYLILTVPRCAAVRGERRNWGEEERRRAARLSGGMLMLLSLAMAGQVYLSDRQEVAQRHGEIVMITIAAYTFVQIGFAVADGVKNRKNPELLSRILRFLEYAEILASVLTLQRSMLASFGGDPARGEMTPETMRLMNLLTGVGVCWCIFSLGFLLLRRGRKKH